MNWSSDSLELSIADLQELTGDGTSVLDHSVVDFDEYLDKMVTMSDDSDSSEKCQESDSGEADNTERKNATFNPFLGSNSYHDNLFHRVPSKQFDSLSAREQPAGLSVHHPFTHTLPGNPRVLSDSAPLYKDISGNPSFISHSWHLNEHASENQSIVFHSTRLSEKLVSMPHNHPPSASHNSLPSSLVVHKTSLQNLNQNIQEKEIYFRDLHRVKVPVKRNHQGVNKKDRVAIKRISYADIKWSRSKRRNIE